MHFYLLLSTDLTLKKLNYPLENPNAIYSVGTIYKLEKKYDCKKSYWRDFNTKQ